MRREISEKERALYRVNANNADLNQDMMDIR